MVSVYEQLKQPRGRATLREIKQAPVDFAALTDGERAAMLAQIEGDPTIVRDAFYQATMKLLKFLHDANPDVRTLYVLEHRDMQELWRLEDLIDKALNP